MASQDGVMVNDTIDRSHIEMTLSTKTMEILNFTESWTPSDLSFGSVIPPEDYVYSKLYENFKSTLYKHKEVGTVILVILYVPVFLMAFIGNLMVLLVVLPNRHMRNVTNFFIVNLAVADLTGNSFLFIIHTWQS